MNHSLVQALFVLTLAPLVACAAPGALEINQDCAAVGCFAGVTDRPYGAKPGSA